MTRRDALAASRPASAPSSCSSTTDSVRPASRSASAPPTQTIAPSPAASTARAFLPTPSLVSPKNWRRSLWPTIAQLAPASPSSAAETSPVHAPLASQWQSCAQDCHWEAKGAWTGEVSAALLGDAGASWAIVGHSERRQFFGDTSDGVGKKARAVLAAGLGAIVCVGGALAERDAGRTLSVVDEQLDGALAGLDAASASRLVIAYDPVWAIGRGRPASPAQAQEVHAHIRKRPVPIAQTSS